MRMHSVLFLLFLACSVMVAQMTHPLQSDRGDVSAPGLNASEQSHVQIDTVRILALMVQFKQDNDPRTTGDGRFQLNAGNPAHIDPPPHDGAYFSYKLRFLENYYRKVSNNQLILIGDVFPTVITLADSMAVYSPSREGSNQPLARLAVDAWTAASKAASMFPFSSYKAFIIFHAGAGRDIDLVSQLGFDPTPNDIPSLYLSLSSLRKLLNAPGFPGIAVNDGSYHISNSLIIPATESRVLTTSLGPDTLQLSTNGLLAATFGSYLGLPDLFNTKNGRSAIGQFGLMDGAGIFAFRGLFPPEPSAWEKIHLGWTTPIVVQANTSGINLPAVSLVSTGRDTVYKIPISTQEYYLVENRQRDPHGNGQQLRVYQGGKIVDRLFARDTTGFQLNDVRGIGGTIFDVEDFDWALPGAMQQKGFEGGGMLVWHIDEKIIAEKITSNEVNADPKRRGVRLIEADGSNDIGEEYAALQPGSGTEYGWPLDCWFQGNSAPKYRNLFNDSSYPSSRSNSGSPTLIALKDFSALGPRMNFSLEIGNVSLTQLDRFSRELPPSTKLSHPTVSKSGVYAAIGEHVYAFKRDGSSKTRVQSGLLSSVGGTFGVAVFDQGLSETIFAGASLRNVYVWRARDLNSDGVFDTVLTASFQTNHDVTTSPSFYRQGSAYAIAVGTAGGGVHLIGLDGVLLERIIRAPGTVTSMAQLPTGNPGKPYAIFQAVEGQLHGESNSTTFPDSARPWLIAGVVTPTGNRIVAAERGGKKIVAYDQALSTRIFETEIERGAILSVAAADIAGDGKKNFVVQADSTLYVLNARGFSTDGFPTQLPVVGSFVENALVGDIDGDGAVDIISTTAAGHLLAVSNRGKPLAGFPVQAFEPSLSGIAFFETPGGKVGIVSVSSSGRMRAFETKSVYTPGKVIWPQYLQHERRWNVDTTLTTSPRPLSDEFLPGARVYNWPNPVYGNSTQIRFYVSEDAEISVRIFDLAGTELTKLQTIARAGIDGEVTWEVFDVQSGIYLARVEAKGKTRTESAVVKIAVVK